MSTCPSCQQKVEDDFGMVTCSHCGHIFMVGLEGGGGEMGSPESAPEDILYVLNDEEADALSVSKVRFEEEPLPPEFPEVSGEEGFDSPLMDLAGTDEALVESASQNEPKDFATEISEFAEQAEALGGLYEYRLKISGPGTQDILQKLRQDLEDVGLVDSDFHLDPAQETITVAWIGPIVAHRLVARLRKFPLSVEWEQRHVLKGND